MILQSRQKPGPECSTTYVLPSFSHLFYSLYFDSISDLCRNFIELLSKARVISYSFAFSVQRIGCSEKPAGFAKERLELFYLSKPPSPLPPIGRDCHVCQPCWYNCSYFSMWANSNGPICLCRARWIPGAFARIWVPYAGSYVALSMPRAENAKTIKNTLAKWFGRKRNVLPFWRDESTEASQHHL